MTTSEDDRVLDLLGRALRQADPVPDSARHAALGAFSWRTIDAELAALVYDSGMEAVVGTRGDEVVRQLTFGTEGQEIEVMVVPDGGRRLVGQLVPPRRAVVRLTTADAVSEATSDDLGRFRFDAVPPGPARLWVASSSDDPPAETEWVIL